MLQVSRELLTVLVPPNQKTKKESKPVVGRVPRPGPEIFFDPSLQMQGPTNWLLQSVWPDVEIKSSPNFTKRCPKISHSNFYLKFDAFQKRAKSRPYIWVNSERNFVTKYHCKIAQSGHTAAAAGGVGVEGGSVAINKPPIQLIIICCWSRVH